MPPAVAVHDGDWKLIRIFYHGENNQHRYQLYNLKQDIGETNNLAAQEPERVKELDAKIEIFLTEIKAVSSPKRRLKLQARRKRRDKTKTPRKYDI